MKNSKKISTSIAALILTSMSVLAADEPAATTPDGLVLQEESKLAYVYAVPGATLDQYKRIYLVETAVAFHKDWQKDINKTVSVARPKVTANDMERLKARVAENFHSVFAEVLAERGYEVVEETGDDVLLFRPALINLVINQPDVRNAQNLRIASNSAGAATLYAELYDSVSGAIIARVYDPQVSYTANFQMSNTQMTNRTEAKKILSHWANVLADAMDGI